VKIGAWYVVTTPSDDGTFEVGDHISPCFDGAIACREAQGWIDADEAAYAMAGVDVTIDSEWLDAKKSRLLSELAKLDGLQ